ncbi:MAG: hypothetical protein H8D67_04185 [Deltaproteobacteria bacterium]|nr:hypothetical protein [Deltaproteobacteria bacterium]
MRRDEAFNKIQRVMMANNINEQTVREAIGRLPLSCFPELIEKIKKEANERQKSMYDSALEAASKMRTGRPLLDEDARDDEIAAAHQGAKLLEQKTNTLINLIVQIKNERAREEK